jgi:hypothetical protein
VYPPTTTAVGGNASLIRLKRVNTQSATRRAMSAPRRTSDINREMIGTHAEHFRDW